MCYNGRPGAHVRAEISIIPCPGQFVKQNLAKSCTNYFSQFCAGCLLKSASGFAIISMSVGGDYHGQLTGVWRPPKLKMVKKNLLTNSKACAIIRVQKREGDRSKQSHPIQKVQKLLKKVLDKRHKMCYNKFRGKGNNPSQIKNILS